MNHNPSGVPRRPKKDRMMTLQMDDKQALFEDRAQRGVARGADDVLAEAQRQLNSRPAARSPHTTNWWRQPLVAAAAIALFVAGAVAVYSLIPSSGTDVQAGADDPEADAIQADPVSDGEPEPTDSSSGAEQRPTEWSFAPRAGQLVPLVLLDQPGFAITGGYQDRFPRDEVPSTETQVWVLQDQSDQGTGSLMFLATGTDQWRLDHGDQVTIGAVGGRIFEEGPLVALQWPIDGHDWYLIGAGVGVEDTVDAARSLSIDSDGVPTVVSLPEGFELIDSGGADTNPSFVTAEFNFDIADRPELTGDILITSGQRFEFWNDVIDLRFEAVAVDTVTLGDHDVFLFDRGDDTYRTAIWQADGFVIQLRSRASLDELADLVGSVRAVDETEWRKVVPEGWVSASDVDQEIADILSDIPTPPGMWNDTAALDVSGSRYQVVAQVTGAVTCRWVERWIEGTASGDQALADEAAAALATAREWDALVEIADEGGWSPVVWEFADAVNGDGTLEMGRTMTVEESYADALGCR